MQRLFQLDAANTNTLPDSSANNTGVPNPMASQTRKLKLSQSDSGAIMAWQERNTDSSFVWDITVESFWIVNAWVCSLQP